MRNSITLKSISLLLASLMLAGCGAKSGKSKSRSIAPPAKEAQAPNPQESADGDSANHDYDDDIYTDDYESEYDSPATPPQNTPQITTQNQGEIIRVEGDSYFEDGDYLPEEDYGTGIDVIEKDRIYDEESSQPSQKPSSQRMGELGAVVFNDPSWFPGLPDFPAGHPNSKLTKVFTGGISDDDYRFTDGKSDSVMAFLVNRFNQVIDHGQPFEFGDGVEFDESIGEESKKLANRIMNVQVTTDTYSTSRLKVVISLVDGSTAQPVDILLMGNIDANRKAMLVQTQIPEDKGLQFRGLAECLDRDGGCQNVRITLAQEKNGKYCRIAYLVHRSGDAHITMSESDRLHYSANLNINHQRLAEYIGNTAYNACLVNKRRTDLPNRITQHLLGYCGDSTHKKLPAAKTIGYETWAVAYGASGFSINLADEAHWTGYDPGYQTTIKGPLVHASNKNPIFSKDLRVYGGTLSRYIKSAHLVNNDGAGNINLVIRTNGPDESEMRISVTSMIRNTLSIESGENLPPK